MSISMDELLQQMQELTSTVREHQAARDNATIDYEQLAAEVVKQQQAFVAEQQRMPAPEAPVRRGEEIAAPGEPVIRTGKYAGVKAVDLWLAKRVLDAAQQNALAAGPSDELKDAVAKAMTAGGAGVGDELVPLGMAAQLWEDFHVAARVGGLLTPTDMPTDPFYAPLGLGDGTWRKGTENTAPTASDLGTAKATYTSTEQVLSLVASYNLEEDAMIAVMPAFRASLIRQGGEQIDKFIINADATNAGTGNINLDDADPPDDSYYLTNGQDGIRALPITENTGQLVAAGGDALTDADMVAMLKKLGKYGLDPNNTVIVPGVKAYLSMLGLTNVVTVDKYGPQATILRGELLKYQGVPVVPSDAVPLTEADGKCAAVAASNTLGQIVAFHRPSWGLGYRRGLMIEVDRDIQKRSYIVVVSFRIAVAAHGADRTAAIHTAGIANILV